MFRELWKAFDGVFDEMDKAFDKLDASFDRGSASSDPNVVSETTTEVETKPDGTVIRRTRTTERRRT
jgi:hypothetical protein